jgi:hypothetical protein
MQPSGKFGADPTRATAEGGGSEARKQYVNLRTGTDDWRGWGTRELTVWVDSSLDEVDWDFSSLMIDLDDVKLDPGFEQRQSATETRGTEEEENEGTNPK